jgi:hypothetical protein
MHMHPCRTGFCFKSTQPEKMCSLSRHTVGNLKSLWRFAVCNIRKVLLVFTRPALLASTRLDAVKQRSPSWMSFVLCASRCYDEVRRPTSLLFFVSLTVLRASSVQKCQVFANGLHQGFFSNRPWFLPTKYSRQGLNCRWTSSEISMHALWYGFDLAYMHDHWLLVNCWSIKTIFAMTIAFSVR